MKKKLIFGICIFVCLICLIRIFFLNTKYPQPQIEIVSMGDNLNLGDYNIKLSSWEWKDSNILKEIAPNYTILANTDGSEYPAEKERVALATLEVSKVSDADVTLDMSSIALESGGWHNQWDAVLYEELNGIDGLYIKMEKGETKEIIIPVVLFDFQFLEGDWEHVTQRNFYIVCNNYPTKSMIVNK